MKANGNTSRDSGYKHSNQQLSLIIYRKHLDLEAKFVQLPIRFKYEQLKIRPGMFVKLQMICGV